MGFYIIHHCHLLQHGYSQLVSQSVSNITYLDIIPYEAWSAFKRTRERTLWQLKLKWKLMETTR